MASYETNLHVIPSNLQKKLDLWKDMLYESLKIDGERRKTAMRLFAQTFVPPDVNEADANEYADRLSNDDEYLESLHREIEQCATRTRVESINDKDDNRVTYTLLAPESSNIELDVVRELSFISEDGQNWTAEG